MNWEPKISLREGVKRTIAWLESLGDELNVR
jgi:nucleoside-diphosphate-sugar epimerase